VKLQCDSVGHKHLRADRDHSPQPPLRMLALPRFGNRI